MSAGITETAIPGLLVVDLDLHGDNRGWFKENWQRRKMVQAGLPDFGPVQNNISFNTSVGTTRGIHAEPWDKYVSVASGRVFGAWVDLREGESFARTFTLDVGPSKAVFVPRGVGNAFQTVEPDTVYTYLVNDHWSPEAVQGYAFLNLADPTVRIPWPIPLGEAELSAKDREHPWLDRVTPLAAPKTLVLGADGQLGRALRRALPDAEFRGRHDFDITDSAFYPKVRWADYDAVINAAAFTDVDAAESAEGRRIAWSVNARGPALLAATAAEHRFRLVHISSDYVFDGTQERYGETDSPCPLGIYGQTKAAGDAAVGVAGRHYIVRTSWVVGEGSNFVRTMASLAHRGISPSVVADQVGRLTFANDLADAVVHLLHTDAPYGTYNATGSGSPASWAEIAEEIFRLMGKDPGTVRPVSTVDYYAGRSAAPRPANSVLSLDRIESLNFRPRPWRKTLATYVQTLTEENRAGV